MEQFESLREFAFEHPLALAPQGSDGADPRHFLGWREWTIGLSVNK